MNRDLLVGGIFLTGILLTLALKDFTFLIIPSVGIPISLAYLGRYKNILVKSHLFEKDTLAMIVIISAITIAFNFIIDPRIVLLLLGTATPMIAGFKG
ncbi:hypothetical protein P8X24_00160 [Pyrococcus kukulkanii]|uniref:hypothetical protein n=1 Tax=Pyrococcus kukulkanii TaxID=1609559 RepID=UPI000F262EF6|nr:MAG: hypothetical protein DRN82_00465 [Thermococci archaeon]